MLQIVINHKVHRVKIKNTQAWCNVYSVATGLKERFSDQVEINLRITLEFIEPQIIQELVIVGLALLIDRRIMEATVIVSDCGQNNGVGEVLFEKIKGLCNVVFYSCVFSPSWVIVFCANTVCGVVSCYKQNIHLAKLVIEPLKHGPN